MNTDPFLSLSRPTRALAVAKTNTVQGHADRAHSKFSASGAERWFKCPGSVELSEGLPDKSSPWALEGTEAHEVLERVLKARIERPDFQGLAQLRSFLGSKPRPMLTHANHACTEILKVRDRAPGSALLVETRIYLKFIHEAMFGTFDSAVIDYFDTLHVFDYKYGQGHAVSPRENLQMIFYGIGVAHEYHWNFSKVRLWIIQPRIRGYDGPLFWDVSIAQLKEYADRFREAVRRVEQEPDTYVEGTHCHWCKAKSVCPLKLQAKIESAKSVFAIRPIKI